MHLFFNNVYIHYITVTNMRFRVMMVLLVFMAFLLPLVSSSIFVEPLNPIYNYGDTLTAQTKIVPSVSTSGHYTVDLKCGNITINIFNNFFDLPANVERSVLVTTQVLNPLLNNITSSCLLRANFVGESVNSNSFTLSNKINVEAELDFDELNPGNSLVISGTAIKESGVPLNGFVELFVSSLNLYKSSTITNGVFNISLILPADVKSGKHNVTLEVHNTDSSSRKINFGSFADTFTVAQVLKEFEIVVVDENVNPGTDFVFRIDSFDQAGDAINKDVSLVMNDPKGLPFLKKIVKSGESQILKFFLNNTPGYWNIEATIDGESKRKLFYLMDVKKVQTSLINNTLFVTNIGNSIYSGPIEITIGSQVEVKQVKLGVGETQKFTLRAPDGDYSISVSQNGESESLGSTFLTGNAIKVTDLREDLIGTVTNPIIWWLIAILFVLVLILVQVRKRMLKHTPMASSGMIAKPIKNDSENSFSLPKKDISSNISTGFDKKENYDFSLNKTFKSDSSSFAKPNPKVDFANTKQFVAPKIDFTNTKPFVSSQSNKVAPSSLFESNQGIREHAVAIALYIGGSSNTSQILNNALSIVQETGVKVYVDGDYKIILFSPKLTNNSDNESAAVSVGRRIQALFLEHARDNNDGVLFGIGISNGEIISEIENGKFHFTSTGNLISFAKRIAQSSNMKLLISDSVRRKVISNVKVEKSSFQGVWEITRVIDHSQSRDFIKRFSDRNK